MNNSKLDKIKPQTPVSILIHGGNRSGYLITKTLIEQGCHVIIVDHFNSQTSAYISDLKKSGLVDFFEFKGLDSLFKNIKKIDYLFYFLNKALNVEEFDSKTFLKETTYLDSSLKNAQKHNAKFSLISSLQLNRALANRINNEKLSSPSPYSNIELQKYAETLAAEFRDKTNLNLRIIRLGTIIGKGVKQIDNTIIQNLIKDATQKPQITIMGEGLDVHNIINENDATYGILKLTFSDKTKGEVITLANKNNYTTLSIAYKLLELNTEAQSIKFVDNPEDKFLIQDLYVPAPHASKYGWVQQVTLEESLVEQIQTYYDSTDKSWDIKKEPIVKKEYVKITKTKLGEFLYKIETFFQKLFRTNEEKKEINWYSTFKIIGITALTVLVTYFLIYPLIGITMGVLLISTSTKDLTQSVLNLNQSNTKESIANINGNINRISSSIGNLQWAFNILGKQDLYSNTTQLILGAQYLTEGSGDLIESVAPLTRYIQDFQPALDFQTQIPESTREYREYLTQMQDNQYMVKEANYKISLASEIINRININLFPTFLQNKLVESKDMVNKLKSGSETFQEVVTFLPQLLGVDERQRYLILLQNEGELRSTGGWLTSYAIVGIEGGQVRELFVDDVYNADGTLKVQGKTFQAPKSMQQALGLNNWSFSTLNWYPDLSDNLVAAEPFVKALGKGDDLDGIATMDIGFIQKLLDKWGGIEVPGETEIITSENIYSKIFKMHEEFVPGSTQKTTFLANLANEIIQKVLSMKISDLLGISSVFEESLNEKHLQATFKSRDAYNFFSKNSWASSLDTKYNDAPIAIDWNWGGNKANLYLDKNYNLSINILDENTIDFTYIISVENTSATETYPEGNYVNYQRIYTPSNAEILTVDGMVDNKFDVYKESGYKIIGGWFNTPIKSSNTLEIAYRLQKTASDLNFPIQREDQNLFFNLNIFKQAGEKQHAYKLDVTYPSSWNLETSNNLNNISNQLSGRFELKQDLEYKIVWRAAN